MLQEEDIMDKSSIQSTVNFIISNSKTFEEYSDLMSNFRSRLSKEEQYTLTEVLEAIPIKEQAKRDI